MQQVEAMWLALLSSVVLSSSTIDLKWHDSLVPAHRRLELSNLHQVERGQLDVQYGKQMRFVGVPLSALLNELPGYGDLVVARFDNGMLVPLPNDEGLERLGAFVATAAFADGAFGPLPPAYKLDAPERDVRPTHFSGNKLVVKDRWHPDVPAAALASFSPWVHVGSLVSLERTTRLEFDRAFPPGLTADEQRGRELFDQRCRFCHGARGVGATFGWDFVEPVPLHQYRDPESLFMHVRYRTSDAPERGYLMPPMPGFTAADANALWQWMRLLGEP